jgi:hypothetical protein
MKMQGIRQHIFGNIQLHFNDLLQRRRTKHMKRLQMVQKAECIDKAYESEIMIAMQVRNKHVRNAAAPDLVFDHLYLRAFAAIYQVTGAVVRYQLARGVSVECGHCRIIS